MSKATRKVSGVYLWLVLWKAQRALEAKAFAHISSLDICNSDFGVLEILLHKGKLPVNEIGQKLLLTSGSATSAIDRVEKMGFVVRKAHPEDRRIKVVGLTPLGRKFISKAFDKHKQEMEKATGALSHAERVTLVRLLKKLGKGQIEEK